MKQSKSTGIISIADIIFFVAVIVIATVVLLCFKLKARTGLYVTVSVDGRVVETLSLEKDDTYRVETDYGINTIIIKDNLTYVSDADCPDKICVKHKPIDNVGDTIICLPHKLVVEVTE